MSLARSGPGPPERGSRNAPHPLRWRFSGGCADRVASGRSRGFDASCPTPVRGCGCRSRAARRAPPEPLRDRHGSARLAPVNRRAMGGRDGRRLERFAEVCEDLTLRGRSHPGLLPLANLRFEVSRLLPAVFSEPDVATTPRALERKLLPHPGHDFRPRNPRGVVRAGLLMRVAAASGAATVVSTSAGRALVLLQPSNGNGGIRTRGL